MALRQRDVTPEIPPEEPPGRSVLFQSFVILIVLAALVLSVVALLVARNRNTAGPTPSPSASASPSASIPVTTNWIAYSSGLGYTIKYPPDWSATRFEGHEEFYPPGVPSLARGGDTFAIDVTTPDLTSGPTCGLVPNAITLGGVSSSGCETTDVSGAHDAWYTADWTSPSVKLVVHVIGSTPALWQQNDTTARTILSTMARVPAPVVKHGTIASGIPKDALTDGLIGFLETRISGAGASYWMSPNAQDLYDRHVSGLYLYEDSRDSAWKSYRVTVRRGVDANSVEFDVVLTSVAGRTARETIGIGPGANIQGTLLPAIVRF